MTAEEQVQKLTAERDEEKAIVDRVWAALGISTYKQAKPLAIDEHVKRIIAERDAALKALAEARVLAREIYDWKKTGYAGIDMDLAIEVIESADCGKGYVKAESLKCFKCDDGHTPLYCLNCAREGYRHDDEWRPVVEALKEILFVVRNTPSVAAYFAGRKAAESLAHAESLLKK